MNVARFSANKLLYLGNGASYRYSYCKPLLNTSVLYASETLSLFSHIKTKLLSKVSPGLATIREALNASEHKIVRIIQLLMSSSL